MMVNVSFMKHGLYYRLYWTNEDCMTEIQSICTQKNIQSVSSRPSYVREQVVKYFMTKIATFVEKHYEEKRRRQETVRSIRLSVRHLLRYAHDVQSLWRVQVSDVYRLYQKTANGRLCVLSNSRHRSRPVAS